jgi:hypothetical protein
VLTFYVYGLPEWTTPKMFPWVQMHWPESQNQFVSCATRLVSCLAISQTGLVQMGLQERRENKCLWLVSRISLVLAFAHYEYLKIDRYVMHHLYLLETESRTAYESFNIHAGK